VCYLFEVGPSRAGEMALALAHGCGLHCMEGVLMDLAGIVDVE
jgi:hypothetical protein